MNAVVYHPKDIGIGPKIYTSIVQMTISQFLGMFQILYDQRRQIIKFVKGKYHTVSKSICTYFCYTRCGVPSSCCKESYRMESGLIKIRCGFELQDKSKFSDSVVKEKVVFQ